MGDALANWQWLYPRLDRSLAGELLTTESVRRPMLLAGYEKVKSIHVDTVAPRIVLESYNCIAVPDFESIFGRFSFKQSLELMQRIRENLIAKAGIYVGVERGRHSVCTCGYSFEAPKVRCAQMHVLRTAGFSDIRSWYLQPSPELPTNITRAAVLSWELALRSESSKSRIRRGLVRIGLQSLLFDYRLVVARV